MLVPNCLKEDLHSIHYPQHVSLSGNQFSLFYYFKDHFFNLFWLCCILVEACRIFSWGMCNLVPSLEIELRPPEMGAWSPSQWTTRDIPMAISLKMPIARESQGKQIGPCDTSVTWSSGNFSNAKLGRSGLYFGKEKQNPNTYDSLFYPQRLPSTWCSLRVSIINKWACIYLLSLVLLGLYYCIS